MFVNLPFISSTITRMMLSGWPIPAEIHVNQGTAENIIAAIITSGMPCPAPSTRWERFRAFVTRKPILRVWRINGVPLVVNHGVPEGGLVVRPMHMLDNENWMAAMAEEMKAIPPPNSGQSMPRQTADSEEMTSADFRRKDIHSVSDVLMEAATNCDDAHGVIVITIRAGEVRLMANVSKFEAYGVMTAALNKFGD